MKKFLAAIFIAFLAIVTTAGDADAARLGGRRSVGMQRQAAAPRPAMPQRQAAPAQGQPQQRSWLGPVAGLAAGLGLAALFSHLGLGAELANVVMLALLVMAGMFLLRLLRRPQQTHQESVRYAGVTQPRHPSGSPEYTRYPGEMAANRQSTRAVEAPEAADPAVPAIPAGFDSEAFLRVAKLNFVRLQAANDAKNLDDIREFVTPEIFAEIKLQIDERGEAPQQTDIVTLNADLLEVVSESRRYIASVRFSGMIRESEAGRGDMETAAVPFEEIWHLTKPIDGSSGWVIAGIQQVQ